MEAWAGDFDEDVGGLDVSVGQAFFLEIGECREHLDGQAVEDGYFQVEIVSQRHEGVEVAWFRGEDEQRHSRSDKGVLDGNNVSLWDFGSV